MKRYKIIAKALSPIHIGNGDIYEPINFVIDKEGDNAYLYSFDEEEFFHNLPNQDKRIFLEKVSKEGSEALFELFKFFSQRKEIAKKISYKKIKVSSGIYEHYKNKLGRATQVSKQNKKIFNQFMIEKAIRDVNFHNLYIPGSSIKGAINTAFLDYFFENNKEIYKEYENKHLSKELLVSDTYPKKVYEMIGYALNKEKYEDDLIGPKQFIEVIFSNHNNQSLFEFEISFKQFQDFNYHLNIEELIKAVNFHYVPIFKEMFENKEINRVLGTNFKKHFSNLKLKNNQFLLRVGKHSGAEAVTIKSLRKILIKMAELRDNNSDKRVRKLHRKSSNEPKILKNFLIADNRLKDKELHLQNTCRAYLLNPYNLERIVKKRKLHIQGYFDKSTTTWLFGFKNKLKENSTLPFGWLLCEVKEIK